MITIPDGVVISIALLAISDDHHLAIRRLGSGLLVANSSSGTAQFVVAGPEEHKHNDADQLCPRGRRDGQLLR